MFVIARLELAIQVLRVQPSLILQIVVREGLKNVFFIKKLWLRGVGLRMWISAGGEGLKIPISNPIFQFATKSESLLVRFWKVLDLASL